MSKPRNWPDSDGDAIFVCVQQKTHGVPKVNDKFVCKRSLDSYQQVFQVYEASHAQIYGCVPSLVTVGSRAPRSRKLPCLSTPLESEENFGSPGQRVSAHPRVLKNSLPKVHFLRVIRNKFELRSNGTTTTDDDNQVFRKRLSITNLTKGTSRSKVFHHYERSLAVGGHSLQYYYTGVSVPGYGLPEFSSVGYVDGIQTVNYRSDTGQYRPVAQWMAKNEGPEYWERLTQVLKGHQATFKVDMKTLMQRYNQTGVPPEVKVSDQKADGATKLLCQVYGFYPRDVDVNWKRDDIEVHSDEAKQVLPNTDGTYQITVSAEVPPEDTGKYTCHVEHTSLDKTLIVKWEPKSNLIMWIVIGVAILAVIGIAAAGYVMWKKRSEKKYIAANASDKDASSASSNA
ncbi:hereditary hemochromatosis isoform X3 [Pelobates cultripes]|uniref:Hereditary hemochromatosis isoform X3 n=1 Tax=Pelobates cultripes TaxID=61616 RepID=A0AAD1WI51_PELCU|nr:hereditary hemochromatosis isoform X3 [Pelobates cultripes]